MLKLLSDFLELTHLLVGNVTLVSLQFTKPMCLQAGYEKINIEQFNINLNLTEQFFADMKIS